MTKLDEADDGAVERIAAAIGLPGVGVSVLDDESLDRLPDQLWRLTGLIHVFLRRPGAAKRRLSRSCRAPGRDDGHDPPRSRHGLRRRSRLGPSAKFDGQRVGAAHVLEDDDVMKIL